MESDEELSSSTSFSAGSFDSCSDLLSLLDKTSSLPGFEDFAFAHLPSLSREADHEFLIDTQTRSSRKPVDVQNTPGYFASGFHGYAEASEKMVTDEDRNCTDGVALNTQVLDSHRAETGAGMVKRDSLVPNNRSGLDFSSKSKRRSSLTAAEADSDLDLKQLENSIKFFDLHYKSTPLRSINRGHSSSDINLLKEAETGIFRCSFQTHRRSSSYDKTKGGAIFAKEKQPSSDLLSWLDYEDRRNNNSASLVEKADHLIESHTDRILSMHFDDSSETTGSSDTSPGWKAINRELNDHFQSLGEPISRTQISKDLPDPRMDEPEELATVDQEDLGPDEIGRYLEPLDVNEAYLDAKTSKTINPDINYRNARSDSSSITITDNCQRFSVTRSQLPCTNCFLPANEIPFTVNSVQVVGARQQRGGSSMWQRMVGVKDHTVYCIKVVSGKHEWEAHRRHRDFMNLYQQLRRIFTNVNNTSSLPLTIDIENQFHRVLGNISPSVVEARVMCIEKFLLSLLQAGPPYSTATPLFWFLRPPQGAFENTGFEEHLMVHGSTLHRSVDVQLGTLNISPLQSPSILGNGNTEEKENPVPFKVGRTIKLVLNIHQNYCLRELLHSQHYACAGCYRHLDYKKGLIHGFTQAFGQGKPIFCEYTGQLFCSSCHLNELTVVPAYVLWHWDFTQKRVCQSAKAYLDSIYDQPLLCVSTANPYLYQRVPCLAKVQQSRAKLSRVLSCIRCPFHSHILNIMGSRKYLLEKNDIFALRDLEDLSKGAFAVLPGLLNSVLKTLMLHVTKQCSVCQDSGEWCGAGILCEDPFQPIFPFIEEINIVNCKVCNAPFHEDCLAKCPSCPSCPKNWVGMNPLKASLAV